LLKITKIKIKLNQSKMKYNFKTPHLLLALALAVGIVSLTPAGGGEFTKARILLGEETTNTGSNYTEPATGSTANPTVNVECNSTTGANCGSTTTQPQNNYNQQNYPTDSTQTQPYNNYNTSGSGGGCAPGTTCNYNGGGESGGMQNPTPSDTDCQFDKRDAHRMYNEINQLIKRKTKAGEDTTELNSLLTTVTDAKTKLESCSSLTWEELQAVRQTLMGDMGSGGVNATLSQYRCWDDYARQTKDYERMKTDFERTKKDLESMPAGELSDEVDAQIERMDQMLELTLKMLSLMKDNDCNIYNGYSDAQMEMEDLRWEMDDLRIAMDEFWPKFEQIRNTAWAEQMFTQVETDIAKGKEDYANMTPEMQKKFDTVAQVATDLVTKGRACLSSGDVQCVKEVQMRLEELGRKANQIFGGPDVDFEQMGFDKSMNTKFEQVMGDRGFGEATEIVKYLIELDPTILDKIMDPAMADKIFKVMGKMPEKMRAEYMTGQSELKDTLDEAITTAPQLNAYKNDILGANLMGDALTEAVATLEDVRDGSVQATEFIQNLEQYKTESRSQEVELGVSKFEDATSDTWYYDAAHDDALNISGKTVNGQQVFDPSGQTTFAEMLKVIDEATGVGQSGGTSYGAAQNHWSAGYYGSVEGRGVTFMNPDQRITRGEMARMIVEITGIPMQDVQTPFVDLAGNKYESYIKTLYANGVMNGNPDGTVKPNDSINRAEAFTLVKNMIDNLGLMAVDVQAIQEIETMPVEVNEVNYVKEDQSGGSYDNGNGVQDTSDELYDMMDW
jgi:hypothetical protein